MSLQARINRIEQATRQVDQAALDYVARRYGLTEVDLDWLSNLKSAVSKIWDARYWYEPVDQAMEYGGLELTTDADGNWIAILHEDEDESDDTD